MINFLYFFIYWFKQLVSLQCFLKTYTAIFTRSFIVYQLFLYLSLFSISTFYLYYYFFIFLGKVKINVKRRYQNKEPLLAHGKHSLILIKNISEKFGTVVKYSFRLVHAFFVLIPNYRLTHIVSTGFNHLNFSAFF